MSQRKLTVPYGSPNPNREVFLSGTVTIGASGAISSQTPVLNSGVTATVDTTGGANTGRYLLTFDRTTYKSCKSKVVNTRGPATGTAFPTTTGGAPKFRDYTGTLPETSALSVQFVRSDTQADADPASGTQFTYFIVLEG